MNYPKTYLAGLLSLLLLVAGCKKDSADSPAPDEFFVKAKINGTQYQASGVFVYAITTDDTYNVYATFDGGRTMYFQLGKSKGIGIHALTGNQNFAFYRDETNASLRSDQAGGSGEVTITEKSATVVKGTFKCVVKESNAASAKTATFTEGEFAAKFR